MRKLNALIISLFLCGSACAANIVPLSVSNNGIINPKHGSVNISLDPLYPSKPYEITCTVTNTAAPNKVQLGVVYPIIPGVKTIYSVNNKQFVRYAELTDATNTFIAENIENTAPLSSVLTLINLDDQYEINVTSCTAKLVGGVSKTK